MFKQQSERKFDLIRRIKPNQEKNHNIDINLLHIDSVIEYQGNTFIIDDIYMYTDESDFSWKEYQLINVLTLETKYMSVVEDDEIEIYFTHTKLKLRELGIKSSDIEHMSNEEEGRIEFNGITYYYEDDYGVTFRRTKDNTKELCYVYEFKSDNNQTISIEEWEDGSWECFVSNLINRNNVKILSI